MVAARSTGIRPYLIISGHDYRSKRKANVHFIARELATRGPVRLFSLGFSLLSRVKMDPRSSLWNRANYVEEIQGVQCFLWRTTLHPVNLHCFILSAPEREWFKYYARHSPDILDRWILEAEVVVLESGLSVIYFDYIKRLNPSCQVIYICSDALETIGSPSFVIRELKKASSQFDGIRIPSRSLVSEFSSRENVFYVPHGMDPLPEVSNQESPYNGGVNIVSVGSMLFDRSFFTTAAAVFPNVNFHIIGGGWKSRTLYAPNIIVYDEMAFSETLRFIVNADAGIAPYKKAAQYLTDTSMKLMQYGSLGVPAICPGNVVGTHKDRFGYEPANRDSIVNAINSAIKHGHSLRRPAMSWSDVVDRILEPNRFPDTFL